MSLPTPVLPAEPTLFPLTDLAITRLTGNDRVKYLQGQVTCDVNTLQPGQSTLGGHCDPKGKLWSDFHLLCLEESLLMLTKPSVLARQLPELKKFAVFAKVEIGEFQGQAIGLAGQGTDAWIAAQYGLQETGLVEGGMAVRVEAERWLLVSEQPLDIGLPVGQESLWWGLDIKAGIPHLEAVHQGEYIPQMLNLQALDGISFTKGCYTGQEIVARMQYRGTLKKAMYRISGSGTAPSPNTAIFQENNTQAVGHIVNAENIDEKNWEALAVINHDAIEHTLHLENAASITVLTLPYTL